MVGVLGLREIANAPSHPAVFGKLFVVLFFIPTVIYFLGGLFCFSWNLPSYQTSTNTASSGKLKTLRLVNDCQMGLVILLCLSELGAVIPLRTSIFNNPVVCLHGSMILFVENVFESASNIMRGLSGSSGFSTAAPTNGSRGVLTCSGQLMRSAATRKVDSVARTEELPVTLETSSYTREDDSSA
ncbi:hypothetical protein HKX48_002363 [Thoreauomyces humboldtii]|nr:hypothetical protein HKX48_002363 [Thoreauomyces humboldtii]